jgi:hypothetical protein
MSRGTAFDILLVLAVVFFVVASRLQRPGSPTCGQSWLTAGTLATTFIVEKRARSQMPRP